MKSINDIKIMLTNELTKNLDRIKNVNNEMMYLNEILGDTSFILARFLYLLLQKNYNEWNSNKWIDDCLITDLSIKNEKIRIEGVVILGNIKTTMQWTSPFSFETDLLNNEVQLNEFTFLFGDIDNPEITYEDYRDNRDYWFQPNNRNWKYIINNDYPDLYP
jgi:hypothetical protein